MLILLNCFMYTTMICYMTHHAFTIINLPYNESVVSTQICKQKYFLIS